MDVDGRFIDVALYKAACARAASPEHSLEWSFSDHAAPFDQLPVPVLDRVLWFLPDARDVVAVMRTCREWHRRAARSPAAEVCLSAQRAVVDARRLRQKEHAAHMQVHGDQLVRNPLSVRRSGGNAKTDGVAAGPACDARCSTCCCSLSPFCSWPWESLALCGSKRTFAGTPLRCRVVVTGVRWLRRWAAYSCESRCGRVLQCQ